MIRLGQAPFKAETEIERGQADKKLRRCELSGGKTVNAMRTICTSNRPIDGGLLGEKCTCVCVSGVEGW